VQHEKGGLLFAAVAKAPDRLRRLGKRHFCGSANSMRNSHAQAENPERFYGFSATGRADFELIYLIREKWHFP